MLSIDVALEAVLDLENHTALDAIGIARDDLRDPDWRLKYEEGAAILTHRIGAAVRGLDFEGMHVPSARGRGANLVIFPDRLRRGSRVELYVGEHLEIPRHILEGRYLRN